MRLGPQGGFVTWEILLLPPSFCRKKSPDDVGFPKPPSSLRYRADGACSKRRQTMRVMVIVKATDDSEKGILPTKALLEAMGKFNQELAKAGIIRTGDGLKPSSQGKRIAFDGPG